MESEKKDRLVFLKMWLIRKLKSISRIEYDILSGRHDLIIRIQLKEFIIPKMKQREFFQVHCYWALQLIKSKFQRKRTESKWKVRCLNYTL